MKKLILFAVFTAVASLCSMTAQTYSWVGSIIGVSDNPLVGITHSLALENDRFAVAYVEEHSYARRLVMHRMEASTTGVQMLNSQWNNYGINKDLSDITYLSATGQMVVLWKHDNLLSRMMLLEPANLTGYSFSELWTDMLQCKSIDRLGGYCFAIWGHYGFALQNSSLTLAPDSPYSCFRPAIMVANTMDNPTITSVLDCPSPTVFKVTHLPYSILPTIEPNYPNCKKL